MTNILKMNLFRFKRSRVAYVLAAVAVFFCMLVQTITFLVNRSMPQLPVTGMGGETLDWGLTVKTDILNVTMGSIGLIIVPAVMVLFALLFLNGDLTNGYAKNLVGYTGNKRALATANILIPAIYSAGVLILCVVVSIGYGCILFQNVEFKNVGHFLLTVLIMYMEIMGYIMMLVALADLSGRHVLVMILGLVYVLYNNLFYQLINLIVDTDFRIEKYTLLGGMTSLRADSEPKWYFISAAIALAVFIGFFALDIVGLKKRELK